MLKEIADNGLDAGAVVEVGELPKGRGYFVDDDGPGIDGTPEEIARLFSIRRSMMSSKYLRRPTRGAVGNGLRVVAGAVLASEGTLTAITRNRRIELLPEWRDGSTTVVSVKSVKRPVGTRVEIGFGPVSPAMMTCSSGRGGLPHVGIRVEAIPARPGHGGTTYRRSTSSLTPAATGQCAKWSPSLRRRCQGWRDRRHGWPQPCHLLQHQPRTGPQTPAGRLRLCQAGEPEAPRRCRPRRLLPEAAYACVYGVGDEVPIDNIPFVVEAWASPNIDDHTTLAAYVNRTPVTGNIGAVRHKKNIDAYGCGLSDEDTVTFIAETTKTAQFEIHLNIISPFMPIISDGKAPDFSPFLREIRAAISKVVRKAHRPNSRGTSQRSVVLD